MDNTRDRLLAAIPYGRNCYLKPTAAKLGLDSDLARVLADELVEAGLCIWSNDRKMAICRVPDPTDTTMPGEPGYLSSVSPLARDLWRALPSDGEMVLNQEISNLDQFADKDAADLQNARAELKRHDLVQLRAGRDGGAIGRVVNDLLSPEDPDTAPTVENEPVGSQRRLERELYEPFRRWLEQGIDPETYPFAEVVVTAHIRRKGKWTNPDVCRLTVTNYENLPDSTVELSTYELKRQADPDLVTGVFEAASHGRWSHRANLVVEVDSREVTLHDDIVKGAERFGLGLYVMWFTGTETIGVRQIIASAPQSPSEENLNDMIETVLSNFGRARIRSYRNSI